MINVQAPQQAAKLVNHPVIKTTSSKTKKVEEILGEGFMQHFLSNGIEQKVQKQYGQLFFGQTNVNWRA